jgi:hypothetical protein
MYTKSKYNANTDIKYYNTQNEACTTLNTNSDATRVVTHCCTHLTVTSIHSTLLPLTWPSVPRHNAPLLPLLPPSTSPHECSQHLREITSLHVIPQNYIYSSYMLLIKNGVFCDITPRGSCKNRVSEELSGFIIRVATIGELETLAATNNHLCISSQRASVASYG